MISDLLAFRKLSSTRLVSRSQLKVAKHVLRGDQVECRLCGWQGRRFVQHICPRCLAKPRHRLIPYAFSHFVLGTGPGRLLHIAPRHSELTFVSRWARESRHAYEAINLVPGREVRRGDWTCLEFADASFRIVFSWHVLEHIAQDARAISEAYRVLEPGGSMLLSVPVYPDHNPHTLEDPSTPRSEYLRCYGHPDHVRAPGVDYGERFAAVGFRVSMLSTNDLPDATRERFGLSSKHYVWHCVRP